MVNQAKEILLLMPQRLQGILAPVLEAKPDIYEIRMRKNKAVILCGAGTAYFIKDSMAVSGYTKDVCTASAAEIESMFAKLAHYSVYTYKESLTECFITLQGGSRVGICAEAVVKNGVVCSVRDISSLNFRIARQITDTAADEVLEKLYAHQMPSTLIIGAPGSGKTTLLREICRRLSSGYRGKYYKCTIVDERGEIAAMHGGLPRFDVGINTDVLSLFPKADGILNALRCLAPDVILADEIGSVSECESIVQGFHSGVKFIITMHAASVEEVRKKEQFRRVWQSGAFGALVCLDSGTGLGKIKEWYIA
ncbi:MAG: Flp pilus assembly complex ATPase component TadA [Clostridia bacterium]|nr:Flp pilus assembly complex ATPase component TadA [Clostridia bacterium]